MPPQASPSSTNTSTSLTRHHHITLIGDSILDNKSYVGNRPSVSQLLAHKVRNRGWKVTNCARDGDVVAGISSQLRTIPSSTTLLVLSVGGNDGLRHLSQLHNPLQFYSVLNRFKQEFAPAYSSMLDSVLALGLPVILMNVYYPRFDNTSFRLLASAGVYLGPNSIIQQEAKKRKLPLCDTATIFNKEEDYANPIEPGVPGGDKLTNNIIHIIDHHDFTNPHYATYASRDASDSSVIDSVPAESSHHHWHASHPYTYNQDVAPDPQSSTSINHHDNGKHVTDEKQDAQQAQINSANNEPFRHQ